MGKLFAACVSCLLATACTHVAGSAAQNAMCVSGEECRADGLLTMTTDGHGYIGKLDLADGRCLNVSLPEDFSKEHIYKPPQKVSVNGQFLPYVKEANIVVTVNGRKIGAGLCGDHYLFVP